MRIDLSMSLQQIILNISCDIVMAALHSILAFVILHGIHFHDGRAKRDLECLRSETLTME
jgi:hypothetical protein